MKNPRLREAGAGAGRAHQHHGRRAGGRHRVPRLHDEPARGVRARSRRATRRSRWWRGDRVDTRARRSRGATPLRRERRSDERRPARHRRKRLGSAAHGAGDHVGGRRSRGDGRAVRPDPVRQRVGRLRRLPGRHPCRPRPRPADGQRRQGHHASPTAAPRSGASPTPAARCTGCRCPPSSASRKGSTCPATRR